MHQCEVMKRELDDFLRAFANRTGKGPLLSDEDLIVAAGLAIHGQKSLSARWECISEAQGSDDYPTLLANYLLTSNPEDGRKLLEAVKQGAIGYLKKGLLDQAQMMIEIYPEEEEEEEDYDNAA